MNNSNIDNWISVEDSLPEKDTPVLACDNTLDHEVPEVCLYNDETWYEYAAPGFSLEKITHWMPLPKPPEK